LHDGRDQRGEKPGVGVVKAEVPADQPRDGLGAASIDERFQPI
jgi:hypothetical protein